MPQQCIQACSTSAGVSVAPHCARLCPPVLHLHPAPLRYWDTWAAYIQQERSARCLREARSLYKRVYSRKLEYDGHVAACLAWLRFEREEGRCAVMGPGACWCVVTGV